MEPCLPDDDARIPPPLATARAWTMARTSAHGVTSVAWRWRPLACVLAGAGIAAMAACALPALAAAQDVQSRTCHDAPTVARGEPSRFEWMARTKARANWRHKVRSMPGLGSAYSDWKLAANLEESCLSGPAGAVCTISAVPCRK